MILDTRVLLALAAGFVALAAPARADVLEIGAEGPVWVAGGPVAVPAPALGGADPSFELAADFAVPANAVADPVRQAAGVPARYSAKVHELAARFDLSPALIEALVWQESRWRENAVSHAGARGLAQLMPGTARYLGVNPDDPFANLEGGARYLREQLDRFDGDLERALAAYNAGPGRVEKAGGIPRIRETQLYVTAILGRLASHSR
ncbi:lytic transglycosylase domain-containing protein [Altererythrobacter sp. H2]|uniref:lytic transglycosylase domain-containing protein n=1 Tax=Altererythrobacter sp. H2 TaxID=3108391 RepID=UPI002B4BA5ED|nr:lytic transglycosylase domain-containing protein [Altererythrobacter sp. H2]WRK96649.1 lytic transglycosylase domain-containing protein [Altererythrobacter sp. H2]